MSEKRYRGFAMTAPQVAATCPLIPGGIVRHWVREALASGNKLPLAVVQLIAAGYGQ